MSRSVEESSPAGPMGACFATTHWSVVLTAGARYINETKKLARAAWTVADDPSSINLGPNAGGSAENSKNIYRLGARYHLPMT